MSEPAARPPVTGLLVVGDVIDDLVVRAHGPIVPASDTPATIVATPGGAAANQACWAAHSGARVRFVGRVGAGDLARHAAAFRAAGVEPRLVPDARTDTGRIVLLIDEVGERTMLSDRGANLALDAGDLADEALFEGVAGVHLTGYSLLGEPTSAGVLALAARARARGLAVSLDPGSVGFLAAVEPATRERWLDAVDVLLPNADEARLLGGSDDVEVALRTLATRHAVVAVTLGADGALATDRAGRRVEVVAPVVEVVDTVGAGDAFSGAFLARWLATGDLDAATRAGVDAGSRAVTRTGGRPSPSSRPARPTDR
ncbi:MAG: carbohydrate kinase family protein [Nitriliruptoraceae bacterium]|nr:carbohydrate kinase family protein [Nitriliruptoraceae bacterium]